MEAKNIRLLLTLLFAGTLMGALDLAIIGPALPVLEVEFLLQERELAGLINAYTLLQMLGALLLAKLADRSGARLIYIVSIIFFAMGSLMIIAAESSWMLFAGRATQGFGAGGIFPASAAVIGARLGPKERGQALGILGMVWGMAFLVGPILGGILLRFSWQWLFAINLPIAAILIVGAFRLMPADRISEPKQFDKKGMTILILAMGALIMAVTELDTSNVAANFTSPPVAGGMILLLGLGAWFWRIEKQAHDPIVKPALFESSQISKSCLISIGVSAIQAGSIFLPALLVASVGVSPADAALLLLPGVVAATIFAPVFGKMINKTGTRFILMICQILTIVALAVYALLDMTITIFILASILGGIGSAGMVGAPLRYIVLGETGPQDRAAAQGLLSVVSSVGRLLGAAIVGAVAASVGGGAVGYQAAFTGLVGLGVLILIVVMSLDSKAVEQQEDQPEPVANTSS